MLSEILKAFKESNGPMDLNQLSHRLGVEKSALEGMLTTLVRQGKLKAVTVGSDECTHCRSRHGCAYLAGGEIMGKVYEIPSTEVPDVEDGR